MSFTTSIANPGSFQQRRRNRKISLDSYGGANSWNGTVDNVNILQQVYRGRYDRIERYRIYDWMDKDTDIARALDMIAEHCTDKNPDGEFFNFNWRNEEPSDEMASMLKENLRYWTQINKWSSRLYRNVRNVIKYGDWFFFRNTSTFELYNLHPKNVIGAVINRETSETIAWVVKNFRLNVQNMELADYPKQIQDTIRATAQNTDIRATKVIPAIHVVHLTLSEGRFAGTTIDDDPSDRYTNRWPFGESFLEQLYKTFKQRELLEDAALIHRVQRAPTRNVWYIDTGRQRPDRAHWIVKNFKDELNQKRIPQFIGQNGTKTVDSVYNPINQLEDYYIPVSLDQRGSKVEQLEGQPWENMPDMDYFKKKMMSALRVPYAWMLGPQEGGSIFNDGRAGVAYQEEIEFSRFCSRIQNLLIETFDFEFKLFCQFRDVNVMSSDFELELIPPDNYEESKRLARQQEAIGVWTAIKDDTRISFRFGLEEFLGMNEAKIAKNEQMVLEERQPDMSDAAGSPEFAGAGLGAMPDMGGAGLGGMGQGLPPMGQGGAPGMDGSLGGGMGGATGADAMGGALAMGGAGGAGPVGGLGESKMSKKPLLAEDTIGMDDLKPAERRYDMSGEKQTPNDKNFMRLDTWLNQKPIATLEMIQKIRRAHMAKRVNQMKRLKVMKIVYAPPPQSGPGL